LEIAQTNYRSCALTQSTRRAGLLMTHALARKRSQLSTIAVQIEARQERMAVGDRCSCALSLSHREPERGVVNHDASRRMRREEAVDVVAVSVGVTGKRTLGQGLQSLAGAIGVALLFPVAILIIGLPIALAVRLVVDAVAWLTALARS